MNNDSLLATECYIGIDPGETTGFAAWDAGIKEFEELTSGSFWDIYKTVQRYPVQTTVLVIEDPNYNRPVFARKSNRKQMLKIAQNVGMNKRDAQLLIEGLSGLGYLVHPVKPTGRQGARRKWDEQTFKNLTGLKNAHNQHVRDAAMMVFGLPLVPMKNYRRTA